MSLKSRFLRVSLTLLAVVAFAGYFAFTTFLFNPLESDLDVDVAGLAPRNVDFFFARAELDSLFDGFPELAVTEELRRNEVYQLWADSPEAAAFWEQVEESYGISKALEELEAVQAQIPLGLELPGIFGGDDLAFAGRFNGPRTQDADWVAYGTLNWAGKLGVELLRYPGLLDLDAQGITVEESEDYVKLSGGQLPRDLYLTRVLNVCVVGTLPEFAETAHENFSKGFKDSFNQRAIYADHVRSVERSPDGDEFEFFLNTRTMAENLQYAGAWPDRKSDAFLPRFLGRFFQANTLNRIVGMVDVDDGLSLDLYGEFSSELMTPLQARAYRMQGAERRELLERVAVFVPDDASLFVYFKGYIDDLLEQVLDSLEPAERELLTDLLRETGKYPTPQPFIDELDGSIRNRFAFIVRPYTYERTESDPPNDGQPVPAVALIMWLDDKETIERLRDTIGGLGPKIGLQGLKPGQSGYYSSQDSGYSMIEYTAPTVTGTGVIATLNTSQNVCMVSNSRDMLVHVLKTASQGAPNYPRLSERSDFLSMVQGSLPKSQLTLWVNPKTGASIFRERARQLAEDTVNNGIDWRMKRHEFEVQVVREHFPGKHAGQLDAATQEAVDRLVEPLLDAFQRSTVEQNVPMLLAEWERKLAYAEAVRALLLRISFTERTAEISLRVAAPL